MYPDKVQLSRADRLWMLVLLLPRLMGGNELNGFDLSDRRDSPTYRHISVQMRTLSVPGAANGVDAPGIGIIPRFISLFPDATSRRSWQCA